MGLQVCSAGFRVEGPGPGGGWRACMNNLDEFMVQATSGFGWSGVQGLNLVMLVYDFRCWVLVLG